MSEQSINSEKIKGLLIVLDRDKEKGLQHWIDELQRRNIPAVVQLHRHTLDNSPEVGRTISNLGFTVGGATIEYFWNKPYGVQSKALQCMKEKVEYSTQRPMHIFNFKYFSCDEITLQAADTMGINYVFMRGTGAEAVVYQPREYNVRILSVSNVPSTALGTGSLCDESLFSRGERPEYLRNLLFNLDANRIILVAQTHLSGMKLHWWDVYQELFDSGRVEWQRLEDFAAQAVELPVAQIPFNQEVNYTTPMPKIPLEDEVDFPFSD